MAALQLKLNDKLYLKDPQETKLGSEIITHSIQIIAELGFEGFTFKKLSNQVGTTETSIYRYFENKHKLLIYLIAWYWNWVAYRISFETNNIKDPIDRLKICLKIVTERKKRDAMFPDIDEEALHSIVINESDKTYHTNHVDADNKSGLFRGYKSLCDDISLIVQQINPAYKYPHALISTLLEAANQQVFFSRHLPALTEIKKTSTKFEQTYDFLLDLTLKAIKP